MKHFFISFSSGILGGILVLVVHSYYFLNINAISDSQPESNIPNTVKVNNRVNIRPSMAAASLDFSEAVETAKYSVVHIYAKGIPKKTDRSAEDWFFGFPFNSPQEGTGSGVIISKDGYIVTNNHVIDYADKIEITLYGNKKYDATIVGTYPQADIAVLKIDAQDLPTLEYANSDVCKVGQWVLAMGNPLKLKFTVTAGIISAKGKDIGVLDKNDNFRNSANNKIESFIQTDAAVNPGNSGGALVDATGKLLGINTAIATKSGYYQGYSFAIPVNTMKRIVDDIIKYGNYKRPYLGINVFNLDKEFIEEFGVKDYNEGVVIENIEKNSAAIKSGLKINDIIVVVNDQKIRNAAMLNEIVSNQEIGSTSDITVIRNNKKLTFSVKMVEK